MPTDFFCPWAKRCDRIMNPPSRIPEIVTRQETTPTTFRYVVEFDKQVYEPLRFLCQLSSEGSVLANGKRRCSLWRAMDPEGFYIHQHQLRTWSCYLLPIHSLLNTLLHLLSCYRETCEADRRRRLSKSRPSQLISACRCCSTPRQG